MLIKLILFISYLFLFIFAVIQETTFAMVFSLILVFLVACFLVISLGFEFLGYLILIVYVGAIAVLFLFMVMLFDRSEYKMFGSNVLRENKFLIVFLCILLALSISISLFEFIFDYRLLLNLDWDKTIKFVPSSSCSSKTFINLDVTENSFLLDRFLGAHCINSTSINISDIELVGLSIYTDFFIPLLLAGFGLLVAMIGCIILTRSSFLKKKFRKTQVIEDQLNRFKL